MKKPKNFKLDREVNAFETTLFDTDGHIVGQEVYNTKSKSLTRVVVALADRLTQLGGGVIQINVVKIPRSEWNDKGLYEKVKTVEQL